MRLSKKAKPESASGTSRRLRPEDPPLRILLDIGAAAGENPRSLAVCVEAETGDPFRVLVATLLSLRNRDEATGPAASRVLSRWPDAASLAAADEDELGRAVRPSNLWRTKVRALREVAAEVDRLGGVPKTVEDLVRLKWVGRKTANLVATLGHGSEGLCVDTHVHRISNRIGLVETRTPAETESALRLSVPRELWRDINDWLVWHGRTTCKPRSPVCSECPVSGRCPRRGVS